MKGTSVARFLLKLAIYAAGIWVAVRLVDGLSFTGDTWALVGVVLLMAAVNTVVKPVAKLLSLPAVLLTLGLFLLVVNAAMLALVVWLAGELDLGLTSAGLGSTFLGAVVVSIVTWLGEAISGVE